MAANGNSRCQHGCLAWSTERALIWRRPQTELMACTTMVYKSTELPTITAYLSVSARNRLVFADVRNTNCPQKANCITVDHIVVVNNCRVSYQ